MKKVSFLSTENMIFYITFFLSNISYVIEIWGNTYKSNINIIMLLQKKIIRIIIKKILNLNLLPLIRLSNTFELFISNNILKLNDLVMFRSIILIYKLLNKNYKIDVNEYFTLNIRNDRFILPLMNTTKYQNTIFFKGIKYYNDIIFGNILKKNKITNINQLKKVMKLFFINQYKFNTNIYFCSDMFNNIKNILFSLILYCRLKKYFVL